MLLTPPFPLTKIGQPFGANDVIEYEQLGLKGHPGIDFEAPWGTPIPSVIDAVCSSVLSRNNPNLMAYRAVFTIVDDGDISYEISYGHCSEIMAAPGVDCKEGDTVANVGNTGDVYVNEVEVTQKEKAAGSHAGAHLHFQVRVLKKVLISTVLDPKKHWVNDGHGLLALNGCNYYVPDWGNGYNGCVDPAQFFHDAELEQVIKTEVEVMQTQPDPVVKQGFLKTIIAQVLQYLHLPRP